MNSRRLSGSINLITWKINPDKELLTRLSIELTKLKLQINIYATYIKISLELFARNLL